MVKQTDNKNLILQVSTRLFYEKGYEKTTFTDIAKECGITKALVTYYFKTKLELAHEVRFVYTENLRRNISSIIDAKLNIKDELLKDAIFQRASEEMYAKDFRANRFYLEAPFYDNENVSNQTYTRWVKRVGGPNKERSIKLMAISFRGAQYCLHMNYYRGELPCTYDEYLDYMIELKLMLLHQSRERREYYIQESKSLFHKLQLTIKPYFIIEEIV